MSKPAEGETPVDNRACEVPLVEQLRSIPEDYRTVRAIQWSDDGAETGHQFIPVGFMMHRAANEIDALKERLRAAERDAMQKCWDAIDRLIVHGEIPGNGCDKMSERNGMIIAANTIAALQRDSGKE